MALDKQIIRENATTATLSAGGGAQELQDKMIGISTDDETIMFRVSANFFHTVNTAGTWTDESIPFADANNRMIEDTDFFYSDSNERLSVKNIQLTTDMLHIGDDDTKWTFGTDSVTITIGGVVFWNYVEAATDYCEFNSGEADVDFIVNGTGSDLIHTDALNSRVAINTNAPSRFFQVDGTDATTNATTYMQRLTHYTSGTAAAGLGAGIEFVIEADDGNTDIDGTVECILTDATGGAVESALVFKTMDEGDDGLTERMRIDKDGNVGLGVSDPDTKLEVLHAGDQLKLSYDGTYYSTLATGATGDLTVTPSGGDIIIAGSMNINTNLDIDGTLSFAAGQAVDTIETTLTDDDTHLPTSGAVTDAIAGFIDGSGTATYIARFNDSNTLENSIISDSGSLATVAGSLDVNGNININDKITLNSTYEYMYIYGTGADGDANTEYVVLQHNGAAGIALTSKASGTGTPRQIGISVHGGGAGIAVAPDDLSLQSGTGDVVITCAGEATLDSTLVISDTIKMMEFYETDGTTDKRRYDFVAVDDEIRFRALDDARLFVRDIITYEHDGTISIGGQVNMGITTMGDGGTTNYANFAADGELTLAGTAKYKRYSHIEFDHTNTGVKSKPTEVFRGVFGGFSLPVYNSDDEELFSCVCIPFDWDGTTDPTVTLATWLASAEDVDDDFNLQVSVETFDPSSNDVVPTTSNDYAVETNVTDGTQYASYSVVLTLDASAIGMVAGQPLGVRIRRLAAAGTEIDGEVVVHGAVVTWTCDKLGQAT